MCPSSMMASPIPASAHYIHCGATTSWMNVFTLARQAAKVLEINLESEDEDEPVCEPDETVSTFAEMTASPIEAGLEYFRFGPGRKQPLPPPLPASDPERHKPVVSCLILAVAVNKDVRLRTCMSQRCFFKISTLMHTRIPTCISCT